MPEWIKHGARVSRHWIELGAGWGRHGKVGRGKSLFACFFSFSSFVRRFHPEAKLARLSMNLSVVSHYAWHGNYFHLQTRRGRGYMNGRFSACTLAASDESENSFRTTSRRTTASPGLLSLQQVPSIDTKSWRLVAIPLRQSRWKRWLAIGGAAEALGANLRCRACRLGFPGRGACGVLCGRPWARASRGIGQC